METLFSKGKRSNVYITSYNQKKAIIKRLKPGTEAFGAISDEALWLKKLNPHKIGPKLLEINEDSVIIEFVKGERIIDWLLKAKKKDILRILKEIFKQCRLLDNLKVSKEEMQNPYKHILVDKKPIMIDFERCHYTEKPQNVTQFSQFLMSARISKLLKEKKINQDREMAISLLKVYKKGYSEQIYKKLLKAVLKD